MPPTPFGIDLLDANVVLDAHHSFDATGDFGSFDGILRLSYEARQLNSAFDGL